LRREKIRSKKADGERGSIGRRRKAKGTKKKGRQSSGI